MEEKREKEGGEKVVMGKSLKEEEAMERGQEEEEHEERVRKCAQENKQQCW